MASTDPIPDHDEKASIERDVEHGIDAGNKLVNRWTRRLLGWGVEARGACLLGFGACQLSVSK
jgi:hypothetical protein